MNKDLQQKTLNNMSASEKANEQKRVRRHKVNRVIMITSREGYYSGCRQLPI